MKESITHLMRNPILAALVLFLAGIAGVLTFSYRSRAEANAHQIVYMSAQDADLYLQNLDTGEITQLTHTNFGVRDFAVSPQGGAIAYVPYNEDSTSDIWLYDLRFDGDFRLTDCVNASCGQPSWRADGAMIAFTRAEFGENERVWTVNPTTTETRLLLDDPYIIGHSPQYTPAGDQIAMFSTSLHGILIYDFATELQALVTSRQGSVGRFSPDGARIAYPILVRGAIGVTFFSQVAVADLKSTHQANITGTPDTPIEDVAGVWRPGHANEIAVTRRYLDERFTEGYQVYLLNLDTGDNRPLIVDADYAHGRLNWSADGNLLLMQRFELANPNGNPAIWLYDMTRDELRLVTENAIGAEFIP